MSKQTPVSGYYRALSRNMFLSIITISFIPVFFVSATILYQFRVTYREKVFDQLAELVEKHQLNIDGFLNQKVADIIFLSKSKGYINLHNEKFLQNKLILLQQSYGSVFVDLGVINEQGIQIAYAGPFALEKAHYDETEWFQEAMKRQVFISDVFLGLRGMPHFIIAVRDVWEGKPWILRATIDFVEFNNLVQQIRIGATGFAFIVNREGKYQTRLAFGLESNQEDILKFFLNREYFSQRGVSVVERPDASGKGHIYAAALLKNNDWLLIYQQSTADAFSHLNRTQWICVIIFILGGAAIVTMSAILTRRMVSRIYQSDREKEVMNQQVIETGKLASIGELAAGIAHEINNPVAIMVEEAGWIQDLLEEEDVKTSKNLTEIQDALSQIRVQGTRCKDITHKLLSFARKTDSRIQYIQLNDMIRDIAALYEQRAKYSMVQIKSVLDETLPAIKGSVSELQQVLLNLINNSLDAMEKKKGGVLTLSTFRKDDQVVVEVQDTGLGIPEANLSRLFDPFFTTKPVGKGTGLGLSICYGIIKGLGGQIHVASQVNQGTTFSIYLPVSNDVNADHLTEGENQ
ncbi:MAG: ATP-binding protein [Desulfatirhabdiaceae bacterium]